MTAPTCMCMVSVSRARNVASTPLTRSISGPAPCLVCAPSSTAVAEPTEASDRVREPPLVRFDERRLLHRLDDELGDAVTPVHLVRRGRVGVDQQDAQLVAV